jgi:DNA-binding phage protein
MPKRSKDWNEALAKELRRPKFAREFILAAMDEGISIQEVLGKTIRAYGVKEFAERAGIPAPNVLRAINPKHNPTQDTLEKLLKPWGLCLTVKEAA